MPLETPHNLGCRFSDLRGRLGEDIQTYCSNLEQQSQSRIVYIVSYVYIVLALLF